MRNSVVPLTLYVQGALGNNLLQIMQNKVSTFICTHSTDTPFKNGVSSSKPLYLER